MSTIAGDFTQLLEASCQAGKTMAGIALSDALGVEVTLEVSRVEPVRHDHILPDLQKPACFLVLEGEHFATILVLTTDIPFVPLWCTDPEQVTRRLDSLASQLHVLMPELYRVVHSWAMWVPDAAESLLSAGLTNVAQCVVLRANHGDLSANLYLVWPCDHAENLLLRNVGRRQREWQYVSFEEGLKRLPAYMRSLLRIRVPVSVVLASTRLPLRKLLEIGPGTIIAFKKSCDETLNVEVANQVIAVGEAVRVDNRFGLWITSMAMPQARFHKVLGNAAQEERRRLG